MKVENRYSYQILKVLSSVQNLFYWLQPKKNCVADKETPQSHTLHCVAYVYAGVIFGQKNKFITSMHLGIL